MHDAFILVPHPINENQWFMIGLINWTQNRSSKLQKVVQVESKLRRPIQLWNLFTVLTYRLMSTVRTKLIYIQ